MASANELSQMIDGKLTKEGKETRNIKVILAGGPSAEFSQEEAEGRFLIVLAAKEETHREPSEPSECDPEEDSDQGFGERGVETSATLPNSSI